MSADPERVERLATALLDRGIANCGYGIDVVEGRGGYVIDGSRAGLSSRPAPDLDDDGAVVESKWLLARLAVTEALEEWVPLVVSPRCEPHSIARRR